MSKRILIVNEEFTPSEDFINEFVNVPEAIPNILSNILDDYDVDEKRIKVYEKFSELKDLDEVESETTLRLLKEGRKSEAEEYQIQLALDFLKKYPQFSVMIIGVESQTSNILRTVIDIIRQAFVGEL